ncbi:hypothetical protein TEA_023785 [Camellia sinensis var. sinensis]|uniref:Phospholipase D n=1 Tax=Camellia sinensis var. sinensis TaxID=542762 RepID=A0A4S4EP01_CAMSN|nr:hypothetical protein TEA_023785 [Camellia sinensis var. sinensis]
MAYSVYGDSWSDEGSHHGQGVQQVPFKTSNASLKVLMLHGNLDICIKEANNLPNMDSLHKKVGELLRKFPGNVSNKIEGNVNVARAVGIPVEQLWSGTKLEGTFPVVNESGKPSKSGVVLTLSIQYISIEKMTLNHCRVGSHTENHGVPGTYFPLRRGGKVRLYQDAHGGCLPNLRLDHNIQCEQGNCWRDIFDAISQARRLIYITGWSLSYNISLVRDNDNASKFSLGELLKTKSQEGVRVLLLVWDDSTSGSILGYHKVSLIKFVLHGCFYGRIVCYHVMMMGSCIPVMRRLRSSSSILQCKFCFVPDLLEKEIAGSKSRMGSCIPVMRRLRSSSSILQCKFCFVPDLLEKEIAGSKSSFLLSSGPVAGCPREPWHDLHCQIDGPAAYDIFTNFEERWLRASKPHGLQKMTKSHDDSLLIIDRIPDIIGITYVSCLNEDGPEAWHVQNLVCGKNVLIDMSIHTAYVKAIRAAQYFIYIENQYFLGSSHNWTNHRDLGANNLIPMEIALKIANKIREKERFSAYIVIPMWPGGVPTGAPTQRILLWQLMSNPRKPKAMEPPPLSPPQIIQTITVVVDDDRDFIRSCG